MDIYDIAPKPELKNCKRLLCIQPHPDDIDIGAGGTIARMAENGTEVIYLTVTDDSAAYRDAGITRQEGPLFARKEEQQAAGDILGVKDYYWLDYPDAGDWPTIAARNDIIKTIRTVQPDFVMTVDPWLPYEAHRDHAKCGLAASEAVLLHNYMFIRTDEQIDKAYTPYQMDGIAYTFTAKPNTFVNIDDFRETKFKAISAHKSQYPKSKLNHLKQYDGMRCRKLAENKLFKFAEGFKVLDPTFLLHIVPETVAY